MPKPLEEPTDGEDKISKSLWGHILLAKKEVKLHFVSNNPTNAKSYFVTELEI